MVDMLFVACLFCIAGLAAVTLRNMITIHRLSWRIEQRERAFNLLTARVRVMENHFIAKVAREAAHTVDERGARGARFAGARLN